MRIWTRREDRAIGVIKAPGTPFQPATLAPGLALPWRCALALWAVCAAILTAILVLCRGKLIYSLDDPYISLQLGWQIAHGHYGLNAGEMASPSSSILFPFVLALFAWTPLQDWAPLLLNSCAAAVTAALFAVIAFPPGTLTRASQRWAALLLITLLCIALNLVGLVFTGLEHSLHVVTSVAVVLGIAKMLEGSPCPRWLIPAIVLLPLWRYEGLALSLGAVGALVLMSRIRVAAFALGGLSLTLGGFVLVMESLGLPALPSSVMVKSTLFADGGFHLLPFLQNVVQSILGYWPAWFLVGLTLAILLHPVLRLVGLLRANRFSWRQELILVGLLMSALIAHILFGAWNWFFRYEVYPAAVGVAGVMLLWHGTFLKLLGGDPWIRVLPAGVALLVFNCFYVAATIMTPLAARGIMEQQYQLHRFAVAFYRKPVAVNDLGWVSYRNPYYVLDLWGLGSEAARKARLVDHEPGWMDRLAQTHGVGVAMIYPQWFEDALPAQWRLLGVLHTTHPAITSSDDKVSFYATSAEAVPEARAALAGFAPTLAPDARIELVPAP